MTTERGRRGNCTTPAAWSLLIALIVILAVPASAQTVDGNLADLVPLAQVIQADPINEVCVVGKSGFDFSRVLVYYKVATDEMFIGIDPMDVPPGVGFAGVGVPGDADGNNNPDTLTNPLCVAAPFAEEPGVGPDEEYTMLFDTDGNGSNIDFNDVRATYQGNTFQIRRGDNSGTIPGATGIIKLGTAGSPVASTGIPDTDEVRTTNDIEVRIDHWSTLTPNPTCFSLVVRAGSLVDGLPEDTSSVITFNITQPAISVAKTVRNVTTGGGFGEQVGAAIGNTVEFQFIITNTGNVTLSNLTARDTLPSGLTFANTVVGATAATSPGPGGSTFVDFTNFTGGSTLAPAATKTVTFRATVAATATGCMINSVTTTGTPPAACGGNPVSATDPASVCLVSIDCQKQVSLDGTTFTNSVSAARGQRVFFRVTLTNTSASDLSNVTLTDTLPAGYINLTESEAQCTTAGNTITCNFGTVAAGAMRTVNYQATVSDTATGTLTNTATVSGSFGTTTVTHTCSANVTVLTPCISCVKEVSLDGTTFFSTVSAVQGQVVTFRVRLTNCGTAPFFQSTLSDTLPAGYNNVQIISPGTCTAVGNTVSCNNLGPVAPGATVTILYRATVIANTGTLTNTATVTGTTGSSGNVGSTPTSTCSASVRVLRPCISCLKEVSSDNVTFSSSISLMQGVAHIFWRIRVTNCGELNLNGVTLDDPFPAALTNVTTADARCSVVGNTVHCNLGTLAPGNSTTVLVEADIPAAFSGSLTNTATVSGVPTGSTTPVSSTCTASVEVQGQVPTLGQWGLIAMTGLLAAAMIVMRRVR
ncbi:MAG: IPTL-CTERM sorting domain-containing protein [Planctomycetes bacterium]|nr:IPTL-CTERM sorting domain-containing protein [Planctomycetota bacterium]